MEFGQPLFHGFLCLACYDSLARICITHGKTLTWPSLQHIQKSLIFVAHEVKKGAEDVI